MAGVRGKARVRGPKVAGIEVQQNEKEGFGGGEKQERPDCGKAVWLAKSLGVRCLKPAGKTCCCRKEAQTCSNNLTQGATASNRLLWWKVVVSGVPSTLHAIQVSLIFFFFCYEG